MRRVPAVCLDAGEKVGVVVPYFGIGGHHQWLRSTNTAKVAHR